MATRTRSDNEWANLLRGNTELIVLSILKGGPLHGYAIAQEIQRRTESLIDFKQGTLYPVLHELERLGFVTGNWEVRGTERPRRVYSISETGLAELVRRLHVWQKFTQAMARLTGAAPDEQPS